MDPNERNRLVRRRRAALIGAAGAVAIGAIALGLTGSATRGSRHPAAPAAGSKPVSPAPAPAPPVAGDTAVAVDRVLRNTPYVKLAGKRGREVALTFDDGPGPSTPQILRILRRTHTPASFFVIGRWAQKYPGLVAAEARAGNDVGDHTETHPLLSRLSPAGQSAEIQGAADAIRRAGAPFPRLFRPPYGSFNQTTLGLLRSRRMLMVLWSADTKDFSRPSTKKIAYAGISGGQPGAVILMHDGGGDRLETVAALPRIIRRLRERGFRLVTISRLVRDAPPPANQPPPHQLSGRL